MSIKPYVKRLVFNKKFQGKHTEYEKALHEEMLAGLAGSPPSPIEGSSEGGGEDGGSEWRY